MPRVRSEGKEKYAVRDAHTCLNKDGNWEWEPLPSSRDDAFLERCRFDTLEGAQTALEGVI
tara:strand:- start:250 stop:432 length:183 start_codon:yes stop_codon:yes gene_type:complete